MLMYIHLDDRFSYILTLFLKFFLRFSFLGGFTSFKCAIHVETLFCIFIGDECFLLLKKLF